MIGEPTGVKLVHVTTVPLSLWMFFHGQIAYMKARGFEIHALSSPGELLARFAQREGIPVHAVAMSRTITPWRDLRAIFHLYRHFRAIRPQIVHAHTPKGGMLGMIGAWLARVPVRIYHIHGLPLVTATGYKRFLLRWSDKLACLLAHRVLCVSHSIHQVAVAERLCAARKIAVLLGGSTNGVDASNRFNPQFVGEQARLQERARYGIPGHALVIGFVGRIVRDKGLVELAAAWTVLRDEYPTLHLLIAGPFEPQDPIPSDVAELLHDDPRVYLVGQTDDTAQLYSAMDVAILPTYREGFPVVPLEAAAMMLPVVATRIPGCVDAVQDGVTGMLVPVRDAARLTAAIRTYLDDERRRHEHGRAGRERVMRDFHQETLWEALYQVYALLLQGKGVPLPEPDVQVEAVVPKSAGGEGAA